MDAMTLSEAAAVLNRHRHQGYDGWRIVHPYPNAEGESDAYLRGPTACGLSEFEAVAVAEKYEQEAGAAGSGDL